jgi:hypothetical protein
VLYYNFLKKHFPDLVSKYKSLYRIFPFPPKEYQKELEARAIEICKKYKIKYKLI